MARARVVLNHRGLRSLLSHPGVVADLQRRGEAVAARARSTAPVQTGAYRDGITVWVEEHPSRTVVKIGSSAPHAAVVEADAGSLSAALDAAGGQ